MAYTTASYVASELQTTVPFSSTTIPSLSDVTTWISEVDAAIDQWAGFVASETARTEIVDYTGGERICLKHSPIISVSALLYNTNSLGASAGEAFVTKTANTDYFVYNDSGEILLNFNTWSPAIGPRRIKVQYTSGYSSTPAIHRMLSTKMTAERVLETLLNKNLKESNDGGSISVGSISITEPGAYGVANYKRLRDDIEQLKTKLIQGTGAYRYTAG